jgi:transposase
MDAREQKAREIAAHARITAGNGYYLVPSQSGSARHKVVVDGPSPSCTCKDFELRDKPCKHVLAVRIWLEQQKDNATEPVVASAAPEPSPKPKRLTYRQDWPNYNAAQTNEKDRLQGLLADLCRHVKEPPPKPGPGRKPIPMADAVFCACFKVYSTFSARRFMCDLGEAHRRGHVGRVPHFNSVLNALENPAVTPILHDLIRLSSLPLAQVETRFAVDSSGFCTSRFTRWFDVKYGVTRETAEWVKVHLAVGVRTNVVTAAKILDKHAADTSQFPGLVNATAEGFTIEEVSADMAYASTENFEAVAAHGGTPYVPFKSNATGGVGGIFRKCFHYFCLHREEFLQHYHQRSNAESTFSMVKRKFGDAVRSKSDTAMTNEVLAKLVCHNLCCLISAWYELGIEPVFCPEPACTEKEGPAHIIKFPGA